jgi:hypothetical protein
MRTSRSRVGSRSETDNIGPQLVDPRQGDNEDDIASPGNRSLLAITATMLVEISLPKLLFAWTTSLLLPAVLLGLAPLAATAWLNTVSAHIVAVTEIGAALVLAAAAALGWLAWRPLFRIAQDNFRFSGSRRIISGRSMRSSFNLATYSAPNCCAIWRSGLSPSVCRMPGGRDCARRVRLLPAPSCADTRRW